jgi:hypothetical protein
MKSGWSALSSLGPPLIGLIGVTIGLLLGNWLNQKSEARKAEREERTRRRIRGEEVASELIHVCYQAYDTALAAETAERQRPWLSEAETTDREDIERLGERRNTLVHQLRSRSQEIPDPVVRRILTDVVTCFESVDTAVQMGEGSPREILATARDTGIDVLRGYLHGEPLPDAGRVASIVRVIESYWEDRFQAEEKWCEEERQRRRQELEQAQQSQDPEPDASSP